MSNLKKFKNILLGSDIEWFLKDINTGEVVSAEGFIKGTKNDPFKFDIANSEWWATSLDCVAAEGNIPPADSVDSWWGNIERLKMYIDSILPQNLTTLATPSHVFDDKYLNTPTSRIFGRIAAR